MLVFKCNKTSVRNNSSRFQVICIDHSKNSKGSMMRKQPECLNKVSDARTGRAQSVGCILLMSQAVVQMVVVGPGWGTDAYRPQGGTQVSRNHNSEGPCRSSVDDSVSLTTTAFVTNMSGCCCRASWIAIASACSWSTSSSPVIMIRFSILVSE